jgi:hypothetical protein
MTRRTTWPDVVGQQEAADRLGVKRVTFRSWVFKGQTPEPRWTVSGVPAWDWDADIKPWAKERGLKV